jgi:hypothetical protein
VVAFYFPQWFVFCGSLRRYIFPVCAWHDSAQLLISVVLVVHLSRIDGTWSNNRTLYISCKIWLCFAMGGKSHQKICVLIDFYFIIYFM